MSPSRVLVTGAGGFIGRHLVRDQLGRGRAVRALDWQEQALGGLDPVAGLDLQVGDVADPRIQHQAVQGIDVVFHLASAHLEVGLSDEEYRRVNVLAVETLLEQCRKAGVQRLVHVSSCGVYGNVAHSPADEEGPFHPEIPYERTKLEGERAAIDFFRCHGFPVVVARPAWVYGPGCARTARLFSEIQRRRFTMVGSGDNLRSAIYISDFLDLLERCATAAGVAGEVFVAVNDEVVTVRKIVDEIARTVGAPGPVIRGPRWIAWLLASSIEAGARLAGRRPPVSRRSLKFFTNDAGFTSEKARRSLGFEARVSLRAGLELTHTGWCAQRGAS